jgi:hypothetical protein
MDQTGDPPPAPFRILDVNDEAQAQGGRFARCQITRQQQIFTYRINRLG